MAIFWAAASSAAGLKAGVCKVLGAREGAGLGTEVEGNLDVDIPLLEPRTVIGQLNDVFGLVAIPILNLKIGFLNSVIVTIYF